MLLTILVFISGIILLLSAALPGVLSRLKIAQEFLSSPIMNVSHQMTVAAGFILLGLCRGIKYKVKRAYQLTIVVLGSSALFSIFKGLDYEEAIFFSDCRSVINGVQKAILSGKLCVDMGNHHTRSCYSDGHYCHVCADWLCKFTLCQNSFS